MYNYVDHAHSREKMVRHGELENNKDSLHQKEVLSSTTHFLSRQSSNMLYSLPYCLQGFQPCFCTAQASFGPSLVELSSPQLPEDNPCLWPLRRSHHWQAQIK
jgi:hypothetical protein